MISFDKSFSSITAFSVFQVDLTLLWFGWNFTVDLV